MNTINKVDRRLETKDIQSTFGMGVRGRLMLGYTIITLIFVTAIAISLYFANHQKSFTEKVIQIEVPTRDQMLGLGNNISRSQLMIHRYLLTSDIKHMNEYENTWISIERNISQLNGYLSENANKGLLVSWEKIKPLIQKLRADQQTVINNINDKPKATQLLIDNILPDLTEINTILYGKVDANGFRAGGLDAEQLQTLQQDGKNIVDGISLLLFIEYFFILFGIVSAIIIIYLTTKGLINYINIFREYSNQIANGDLRHYLKVNTNDEIGQLGKDLNMMTSNLSAITSEITTSCNNMVATFEEVKQAISAQSSGATEQASSINEITVSLEEIEKSSAQTMDKAKTLGEAAEKTRERGQQGLEAVEQSIQGMKEVRDKMQMIAQTILDLSKQTQQVGDITAVVNSLAQQSKMLALNASIEAAKAGEAGKGFAVVASEVKNLAEQSEQSTTQVQKILEDIRHATEKAVIVTEEGTKGVDLGTQLVEQTGDIVRSLSDVINETTIASQQIEAAVKQEGVGIEQITAGMNEINQVTATFVASVRQTTEAISNLSTIAKNLKEHVDVYKV